MQNSALLVMRIHTGTCICPQDKNLKMGKIKVRSTRRGMIQDATVVNKSCLVVLPVL